MTMIDRLIPGLAAAGVDPRGRVDATRLARTEHRNIAGNTSTHPDTGSASPARVVGITTSVKGSRPVPRTTPACGSR